MSIKGNFPILKNNSGLIYLDNAATLQKSSHVIEGMKNYLENDYANIHRGWYSISKNSEELFWSARKKVCSFINALDESEIIFTGSATDSVNKLVQSLCVSGMIGMGDKILISSAEHHANIVPWQMGAERYGYDVEFFDMTDEGQIDQEDFEQKYDKRTKIVSISLVSNVFGNKVELEFISNKGALLVVDASQALPHIQVDVQSLDIDFLFFTGHKIGSSTGIGVLWGKKEHFKKMTPSMGGGGSINHVDKKGYTLQGCPDKFEPGTPHLVGVVSLKLAIEYFEIQGRRHSKDKKKYTSFYSLLDGLETPLILYCLEQFSLFEQFGVKLLGTKKRKKKIGLFSFTLPKGKSPIHLGQYMATKNICIRCGGQCAQPLHESFGFADGTCRISLWGYNTMSDVEAFFDELKRWLKK